jgi:hypothetical protein
MVIDPVDTKFFVKKPARERAESTLNELGFL